MITADQLDKLCVLTYRVVQGDIHFFTQEDWDFLDEVSVHAEDVISSSYNKNNEEDKSPDLDDWNDEVDPKHWDEEDELFYEDLYDIST